VTVRTFEVAELRYRWGAAAIRSRTDQLGYDAAPASVG
jgi:hypothetical protein